MNEDAELREARANLSGAQRGTGTHREASAARRTSEDAHTSRIGSRRLRARCHHPDQKINTAGLQEPPKVLEEQLKERKRSEGVHQRDKQNS